MNILEKIFENLQMVSNNFLHLLLNRTEYYQLQIFNKKLTKMHTHLCIDIRVVLLFVNRTGKLVEMSADEKSWWWVKISSTVDAEKFF